MAPKQWERFKQLFQRNLHTNTYSAHTTSYDSIIKHVVKMVTGFSANSIPKHADEES